jgi:tripartite-type tricarboxylate transporter receptor subunit TctC
MKRRQVLIALSALAGAPHAFAQATSKTVRIVVPFPAGGGTDVLARIVGEKLRGGYAGSVVVENRVGASGRTGVEAVKTSDPDGNTLLFIPDFLFTVYPHSFRKLSYDPVADFTPVAIVARAGLALCAGPALPDKISSVKEYLAWAKSSPKNAFYATTSAGGTPHFVGVMLARDSGVALSPVHYKGGAPALQDLIAGQVPVSVNPIGEVLPYLKSGRLRVLATTGEARSKFLPDVPTLAETYPQIVAAPWLAFFAPAKTPLDVVSRLAAVIADGVKAPETTASFEKFGYDVTTHGPASSLATLRADLARWRPIVKASGFTAED